MNKGQGRSKEAFEVRMDLLEVKMDQLDRKIANKADDVINLQVLQHRRELEDIYEMIGQVDAHIKKIDLALQTFKDTWLTLDDDKEKMFPRTAQEEPRPALGTF